MRFYSRVLRRFRRNAKPPTPKHEPNPTTIARIAARASTAGNKWVKTATSIAANAAKMAWIRNSTIRKIATFALLDGFFFSKSRTGKAVFRILLPLNLVLFPFVQ